MAYKINNGTAAWSAAGTWDSVSNTPTIHASTNITISAGGVTSATFTAPNTSNKATGVLVFCPARGTAGSIIATLQENSAGWVDKASATITITNITAAGWVYFRFTTPYQYTATTAGYYRIKLNTSGASGTTTAAADSGAANFAYMCSDDRTGVPAATDYAYIMGQNATTAFTVTMDGTQSIGNGGDTSTLASTSMRTITAGLIIDGKGVLTWDTAASATLTCLGHYLVGVQGTWNMGSVATPYPTGKIATLTLNQNGTSLNYGYAVMNGGVAVLQGETKSTISLYKTKYASGTGTTADPMITTDTVNWLANDEILVCATSNNATNYQETENKFIKVVNSGTSYTLSNSAGGVEAALTYTHTTDAWLLNITRNVVINTNNTAQAFYGVIFSTTSGDVNIDWVRFVTSGSNTTGKLGVYLNGATASTTANCDYSVVYGALGQGFVWATSKVIQTHTGLISCNSVGSAQVGAFDFTGASNNKTLTDCFAVKNERIGFYINSSHNIAMNTCYAISNDLDNTTVGGFQLGGNKLILTNCESHCNRTDGIRLNGAAGTSLFDNLLCGTKGTNSIDIDCVTDNFNDITFLNSNFASATFVSNYLNQIVGSQVRFHNLNDTTNKHRWYSNFGSAQSTGSGLTDTNVRTAGSLAVRLSPEDSTDGFTWEFKILAKANTAIAMSGFIQKNAAFGTNVAKAELWLPGSTSADSTYTMPNDTNWNAFVVSGQYTGTVDLYATVKIIGITATASAYIYVDDLYNGTNKIVALDTWDNGMPSAIMFEQLGDDPWLKLTSAYTVAGTQGKKLADINPMIEI